MKPSPDEGRALLRASRLDLGLSRELLIESEALADSEARKVGAIDIDGEVDSKSGLQPKAAQRLYDFNYPYNTVGALYRPNAA